MTKNPFIDIGGIEGSSEENIRLSLKQKTEQVVWTIRFNIPLNPVSVNNKTVFVTDERDAPLKTTVHYDTTNNSIQISPVGIYTAGAYYNLTVSTQVESAGGKRLQKAVSMKFKVPSQPNQ